jgi:hypothetical protein
MSNFVSHDAREFSLAFRLQDEAGVDEEEAAGQGKGVHLFRIQHFDSEGHLGIGISDEVLPDAAHIFGNNRIVDDLRLPLDFLRQLLAKRDFLFKGVEIDALADIAFADRIRILLWIDLFGLVGAESQRSQQGQHREKCRRDSTQTIHDPNS